MRKHRLAERLLVDVIGLEWEYVHDEACRWEHVMSERVERKLLELLDRPARVAVRQPDPRAWRSSAGPRTPTSSGPGVVRCPTRCRTASAARAAGPAARRAAADRPELMGRLSRLGRPARPGASCAADRATTSG